MIKKEQDEILSGKKKMVPVLAVTIQQDKDGIVLISANEGTTLAQVLDLLLQAITQCWYAIKTAPTVPQSPIVKPSDAEIKRVVS